MQGEADDWSDGGKAGFTSATCRRPSISHASSRRYKFQRQPVNSVWELLNMAPSAATNDAVAALEEIKAPPGVVLPPREIKGAQPHPQTRETSLMISQLSLRKQQGM